MIFPMSRTAVILPPIFEIVFSRPGLTALVMMTLLLLLLLLFSVEEVEEVDDDVVGTISTNISWRNFVAVVVVTKLE